MRGEIGRKPAPQPLNTYLVNNVSWIGFILPYLELNQLYQNLCNVAVIADNNPDNKRDSSLYASKQLIRFKSFLCPSADLPLIDAGSHYICNAGYENCANTDWEFRHSGGHYYATLAGSPGGTTRRLDPGRSDDAVFFDHLAGTNHGVVGFDIYACKKTCSIDFISRHSGSSNVLLLSENERPITETTGFRWAYWQGDTAGTERAQVHSDAEERVAFCFPHNTNWGSVNDINSTTYPMGGVLPGNLSSLAEAGMEWGWSFHGYVPSPSFTQVNGAPAFINEGRGSNFDSWDGAFPKNYRRARPSSNHPGIVLAAFADRSVRPLNENMNKRTFVWICQPNSGQVVSGDVF